MVKIAKRFKCLMSVFKRKKLFLKHWREAYCKNGLSVDIHTFAFSLCAVQGIEVLEEAMSIV